MHLLTVATTMAVTATATATVTPSFRQIYQFPSTPSEGGTFIENLAVRPSTGELLLSTFHNATMYILDPNSSSSYPPSPQPRPLASFAGVGGANVTALTGSAAEIHPDVFLVTGGYSRLETMDFAPGTMAVFSLDLNSFSSGKGGKEEEEAEVEVKARLLAEVPDTTSMNGMAGLPWEPRVVLSAGSGCGCVYRVDTRGVGFGGGGEERDEGDDTKAVVDVAFTNGEFLGINEGEEGGLGIGINGLKVLEFDEEEEKKAKEGVKGWMYFTNSAKGFIGRVAIGADGGLVEGQSEFEIVAKLPTQGKPAEGYAFDDFTVADVDGVGKVLFTSQHPNAVDRLPLDGHRRGNITTYLGGGNTTFIDGPTSVASSLDGAYIYVGTLAGQVIEISTM